MIQDNYKVLRPSLWRSCRVLANKVRLSMLAYLLEHPPTMVSDIAEYFEMTLPLTSQYLRELNARGFLSVQRSSRYVYYHFGRQGSTEEATMLLEAIRPILRDNCEAPTYIFHRVTAFTHPRRIRIVQHLNKKDGTFEELSGATQISPPALHRHLRKLESRKYVRLKKGLYKGVHPRGGLAKTLLDLALAMDPIELLD